MARKKKHKELSQVQKDYNRERNRIQRQINRMRKRGYMGMEDMLPPKPKRITQASVRRLKKITTKDLYDKADFIDLTTGEVLGSGVQGRQIERRQAAKKAAETRRRRRTEAVPAEEPIDYDDLIRRNREEMEERWQEHRRQRDEENRRRLEKDKAYSDQFSEGQMLLRGVQQAINNHTSGEAEAASQLQSILDNALSEFGEETVIYNLSVASEDVIGYVQESLHYKPGTAHFANRCNEFYRMITQSAPSADMIQRWSEAEENDSFVNGEENWNYPQSDFGTAGTSDFD